VVVRDTKSKDWYERMIEPEPEFCERHERNGVGIVLEIASQTCRQPFSALLGRVHGEDCSRLGGMMHDRCKLLRPRRPLLLTSGTCHVAQRRRPYSDSSAVVDVQTDDSVKISSRSWQLLSFLRRHTEIIPNLAWQEPDVAIYRVDSSGAEVWSTLLQGHTVGPCGNWTGMEYVVTDTHVIIQDRPDATIDAHVTLDLADGQVVDGYPTVSDESYDEGERAGIGGGQMFGSQSCFAYEQAGSVVAFDYSTCSPFQDSDDRFTQEMTIGWQVGDFYLTPGTALKPLGAGSYAAIVETNAFHSSEVRNAVGLFTLHPDGYLQAETLIQIFEWEADSGEQFHTRLNDLAVDPNGTVALTHRVLWSARLLG
jgi:hypothetical protein